MFPHFPHMSELLIGKDKGECHAKSCCGCRAVGAVKRALPSLMRYLKAQFLWTGASSASGSHLEACVWSLKGGGSAEERRPRSCHTLPWLAARRVKGAGPRLGGLGWWWGEGGGGGMVGETDKGGMTIWLSSSAYTHAHTPLSNTLSHALRQTSLWLTSPSLSSDMGRCCAASSARLGWLLLSWN